jgi:hypothetical protein
MRGPNREWVSFDDPDEDGRRWQIDVTFLLSSWQCIFGCGCQGVLTEKAPEMVQGCCSYGAHFSDRKDRDHVVRVAKQLTDDDWEFRAQGRKKGIYAKAGKDEDGKTEWRTRLVDDACIFLNRPGFSGGPGCALHLHALRTGVHHSTVKPEVCWQLPLRRIDEEQEDGTVVSTLTEFAREGWGEGGDDFARSLHRPGTRVPQPRRRAAHHARRQAAPPGRRVPRSAAPLTSRGRAPRRGAPPRPESALTYR